MEQEKTSLQERPEALGVTRAMNRSRVRGRKRDRNKHGFLAALLVLAMIALVGGAAYVLRHLGEPADGETVYPEIRRTLGFVPANSIAAFFQARGCAAQAYHGNLSTLKQRLAAGVPVIAFVSIPGDTHYLVVVGYDAQYLYLADSLAQSADSGDAPYNRKLTTAEFETIWHTATPLSDNIYIVVSK